MLTRVYHSLIHYQVQPVYHSTPDENQNLEYCTFKKLVLSCEKKYNNDVKNC